MHNASAPVIKYCRAQLNYRFFISYSIFLILGIFLPFAIFQQTDSPHFNVASFGALLITILSACRLSLIALKTEISPLAMTFWIFVSFWFGLASFAQTLSNDFFWSGYYSTNLQACGIVIIILGISMYELGRAKSRQSTSISLTSFRVTITLFRVYLLSLFAVIFTSYAIVKLGGLSNVLVTREEYSVHVFRSGAFTKSNALIFMTFLRIPAFVALLSAWYLWINRKSLLPIVKEQQRLMILIIFLISLNFIANYPLALARYWLGSIVLSMLFISFGHTKNTMANWILGFILILLIAFPLTSQFRSMKAGDTFSTQAVGNIISKFKHGDYDAYQQILNTIKYVDSNGFSLGNNFLGSLLFWVPRQYWSSKPYGSGQVISAGVGYSFTNLSEPLWAEAYYAFGYLGVIIVLFGFGYLSGKLDQLYQATTSSKNTLIFLLVPFLMGFQIFFLRGDLMNGVAYSLPTIATMVIAFRKQHFKTVIN